MDYSNSKFRKVPSGCRTPKRDRDMYMLTAADTRFMMENAKRIWDMLVYYCNMPENQTGEIQSGARSSEIILNELLPTLNNIIDELDCMVLN